MLNNVINVTFGVLLLLFFTSFCKAIMVVSLQKYTLVFEYYIEL